MRGDVHRAGVATARRTFREFDALFAVSLIWFLGQFVRYVFPPLFETFRATYGVSNTTLGLLFSGLMLAYAAMQFPSGALADRLGMARVIAAGVFVLAGAAFLLFAAQTFGVLVAAMVLIGAGSGAHKTVAIHLLSAIYPDRTGRTLGVMDAIGQLGGMVAPAVVVFVLSAALGWPVIFLGVGVAGVALAATSHRWIRRHLSSTASVTDAERDDGDDEVAAANDGGDGTSGDAAGDVSYVTLFAEPRFVLFVGVSMAFTFAWNGMTAFLPLYLASEKGLTSGTAGLVFSGVFLMSLVQPATGELGDRIGTLPVVGGTLALAAVGLGALVATTGTPVVVGVVLAMALGFHGFRPVRDVYLVTVIPASVAGGTLGIVRTLMMVVGSLSPTVVGFLSDTASFATAFVVQTAVLSAAVAAVGVLAATE